MVETGRRSADLNFFESALLKLCIFAVPCSTNPVTPRGLTVIYRRQSSPDLLISCLSINLVNVDLHNASTVVVFKGVRHVGVMTKRYLHTCGINVWYRTFGGSLRLLIFIHLIDKK